MEPLCDRESGALARSQRSERSCGLKARAISLIPHGFSQTSSCLPLDEINSSRAPSLSRQPGSSLSKHRKTRSTLSGTGDDSDTGSRASKGLFHSIYETAIAFTAESRSKGKQRAELASDEDGTTSGTTSLGSRSATSSPAVSIKHKPRATNLELPLEWAASFVHLTLPRSPGHGRPHVHGGGAHSPLFYELLRMPLVNGLEDRPGWLVLMVATRTVVYVFESRPASKRTWSLSRELYVCLSHLGRT